MKPLDALNLSKLFITIVITIVKISGYLIPYLELDLTNQLKIQSFFIAIKLMDWNLDEENEQQKAFLGSVADQISLDGAQNFPNNCIGLIYHQKAEGRNLIGTGFLISSNLILTVAHNISAASQKTRLTFYPGLSGECNFLRDGYKVINFKIPSGQIKRDIGSDYCLLKLQKNIKRKEYIELGVGYKMEKGEIGIIGYRQQRTQKNGNRLFSLQFGLWKKVQHKVLQGFLQHKLSTYPGTSGAPIMIKKGKKYLAIAIHYGYSNKTDSNKSLLITKEIFNHLLKWESQMNPSQIKFQMITKNEGNTQGLKNQQKIIHQVSQNIVSFEERQNQITPSVKNRKKYVSPSLSGEEYPQMLRSKCTLTVSNIRVSINKPMTPQGRLKPSEGTRKIEDLGRSACGLPKGYAQFSHSNKKDCSLQKQHTQQKTNCQPNSIQLINKTVGEMVQLLNNIPPNKKKETIYIELKVSSKSKDDMAIKNKKGQASCQKWTKLRTRYNRCNNFPDVLAGINHRINNDSIFKKQDSQLPRPLNITLDKKVKLKLQVTSNLIVFITQFYKSLAEQISKFINLRFFSFEIQFPLYNWPQFHLLKDVLNKFNGITITIIVQSIFANQCQEDHWGVQWIKGECPTKRVLWI